MHKREGTHRHLDHAKEVMYQIALECGVNLKEFYDAEKRMSDKSEAVSTSNVVRRKKKE